MKTPSLQFIASCCFCFNLGMMTALILRPKQTKSAKVELPEEYKAIDSTDCLKGYFDKDSVLQIEFNKTGKLKTK